VSEASGREILRGVFEQAGYQIIEDYPLDVGGTTIHLDGYDPRRRVGYEYVTAEAGDREEITPSVYVALEAMMRRGELAIFLVDEIDVGGLAEGAKRFLSRLGTGG
jgi:hypothetical protein